MIQKTKFTKQLSKGESIKLFTSANEVIEIFFFDWKSRNTIQVDVFAPASVLIDKTKYVSRKKLVTI